MPKAARVGKFRQAAKAVAATAPTPPAGAATTTTTTTDEAATTTLSRGQKKRMQKREQYIRRNRLVMASLKLKHEQDQAKRIDGLDAIKEALVATTTAASAEAAAEASHCQPHNLLRSQKSRQKLLKRESNQLELVMQHPAFQADPMATIREHLKNSLATQAAQREKEHSEHERAQRQAASTAVKKPKRKRHRVRPTRSKK